MVERQSYPFDLIRTPLFFDKFNSSFSKADFNGSNNFQIVVSTVCPDNLSDCLNGSTGVLTGSVNNVATADVALQFVREDDVNAHIKIKNNVTMTLSSDVDVKGVFIRKKSNNFVVFGMVNKTPMRFCEKIIFEKDNVILQING